MGVSWFVRKQDYAKKLLKRFSTKFDGKAAHGLRKRLDSGGNPDLNRIQEFLEEFYHCGILAKLNDCRSDNRLIQVDKPRP